MNTKRFCLRNHDTFIVGRKNNRRCAQCDRERKIYENMTYEQIENERSRKMNFDLDRSSDPIRKMIKETKKRIKYRENLLKETI
jgi:hypothetical protein